MNATSVVAPSGSSLLRPFYPALDGLRAIAFLVVFAVHFVTIVSSATIFQWGWVGVDAFFVLSGFLVTGILYDSLHQPDFFRGFYIRRTLRIFPLFYGFWVLLLLLTPVLHFALNRYNIAMMAYVGNLFFAGARMGLHANPGSAAYGSIRHLGEVRYLNLDHLWSLCVEEQFYLAWPAVMWLVRSRRALLRLCLAVVVFEPVLRAWYAHAYPAEAAGRSLYFSTLPRMDTLLLGAAIALWLRGPSPAVSTLRRWSTFTLIAAPLLLTSLMLKFHHHPSIAAAITADPIVTSIGFTLVALASAALLLLTIDPETPVATLLRWKPLVSLGRISYGLYFFHGFLMPLFAAQADRLRAHHAGWLMLLAAFAATYALAWLSFRFYESPFLRLKSRLAPRPGTVADPPPAQPGISHPSLVPQPLQ